MKREADGPHALEDFVRDHGAPITLRSDNSQMQCGKTWTSICRKYCISQSFTEPNHPHQNPAERYIGYIKDLTLTVMDRTGAPDALWGLCAMYVVYISNRMAHPSLDHRTPFERRHGYTPDISAILHFGFYDPVYFMDTDGSFPQTKERLGHFVGFAEHTGDALTYLILDTTTSSVLARSVVRATNTPNLRLPNATLVKDTHATNNIPLLLGHDDITPDKPIVTFDPIELETNIDQSAAEGPRGTTHNPNPSISDVHIGSRISVFWPDDDKYYAGVVSAYNPDRFLHTITYDDGDIEHLNLLDEIFVLSPALDRITDTNVDLESTPDTDDSLRWKMDKILDHKDVGAHKTDMLVQWDSGETSWLPLTLVKRNNPSLFAEYAIKAHGPWANHYRKKRRQHLLTLRHIMKSSTVLYKYGFRLPRTAKEALEIDVSNGNSLWKDAITKEVSKMEKFDVFKEAESIPVDYTRLRCMMVFDIKLDGTHKARLVADGSGTPLYEDAYSSVVAPEHVRLAMLVATLNDLEQAMIDLENAYLHALTKELAYTVLPDGYGTLSGKILIFHKALYGMRTSGARFHEELSSALLSIGFQPSRADPDLWFRTCDGYHEYIARYVDDLMIFAKVTQDIITVLQAKFSVHTGPSNVFLGGDISYHDGCPFTSAKTYINNTCKKIETVHGFELNHYDTPMATDDHPELDDSMLLDAKLHSTYRFMIGASQWIVTLGRLDIHNAVSTLSHFSQAPRKGHLDRIIRVFGYLKFNHALGISMVPTTSTFPVSAAEFIPHQWREQYPNACEELPTDAPVPLGRSVHLVVHVDASHASNLVNRRSVTGFVVLANGVPVYWHCKQQNTIETSTFGSEIVAARIAAEKLIEYRYKLRMMGVPLDGPAILFGDNKSVVTSCSTLSSTLKKRHNALAYHKLRECVAAGIIRIFHVDGKSNIADILTKPVAGDVFRRHRARLLVKPPI